METRVVRRVAAALIHGESIDPEDRTLLNIFWEPVGLSWLNILAPGAIHFHSARLKESRFHHKEYILKPVTSGKNMDRILSALFAMNLTVAGKDARARTTPLRLRAPRER